MAHQRWFGHGPSSGAAPGITQYAASGWVSGTTTPTATLSSTPSVGDVLIFLIFGMTYSPSVFGYMSLPAGTTLAGGTPQANVKTATGSTYQQMQIAYRVVEAGDGTVWTAGAPPNSTNPGVQATVGCCMEIYELTGLPNWGVEADCVTVVNQQPTPVPLSPPPTVTPAAYPATVIGGGTGFTGIGTDGGAQNTQSFDNPDLGWIVLNAFANAGGGGLYGCCFDTYTGVSLIAGNASAAGLQIQTFEPSGLNEQACFGVVAVSPA